MNPLDLIIIDVEENESVPLSKVLRFYSLEEFDKDDKPTGKHALGVVLGDLDGLNNAALRRMVLDQKGQTVTKVGPWKAQDIQRWTIDKTAEFLGFTFYKEAREHELRNFITFLRNGWKVD
jgi:hypothetical protein